MPTIVNGLGPTDSLTSQTSPGLSGVSNSTDYRVAEIERHLHSYLRWFEKATTPSGETHVADRIGDGAGAFVIDAGNDDWGSWVQILGSEDTPAEAGNVKFDLNEFQFTNAERNAPYFLQVAFGADGATALAAGDYTEAAFTPATNQIDTGPVVIQGRRKNAGTKAWARCKCPGQNTATMSFFFGIHEYEG